MKVWNPSLPQKRRDRLYIIAEILELAREGALKTQIMYKANLSFTQLNDYLEFMLKINFLERFVENGRDFYRATEKGLEFLQRYQEINELLKIENENSQNNIKVPPLKLFRKKLTLKET